MPECLRALAQKSRDIWSLIPSNEIKTHNHFFREQTRYHLAKLIKRMDFVVSSYMYDEFHFMLLSCHIHVSEWIFSLNLPECQEILPQNRSKTWRLSVCNTIWTQNHLVLKWKLNSLSRLANDWAVLWEIICTVNSTICSYHVTFKFQSESTLYIVWMSRNSLLGTGAIFEV